MNVLLDARTSAIRRIFAASFDAPEGAGEGAIHGRPRPIDEAGIVQALEQDLGELDQTPASFQSWSRRQQVMPQPQPISAGRSSQGMPVLRTKRMPVRALAVLQGFSTGIAEASRFAWRQQGLQDIPEFIGDKRLGHDSTSERTYGYRPDWRCEKHTNGLFLLVPLKTAYDDLASTHEGLRKTKFDSLLDAVGFFSPGITVKLVNGETDKYVAVESPYNFFVGGNKLGRGVAIKNLLVSYYGYPPRMDQAGTVLHHARMYGYRKRDIGLLRLFLPQELHLVFKAINKMERGLRELNARQPTE